MINEPFCKVSVTGMVEIDGKNIALKVCELPFIQYKTYIMDIAIVGATGNVGRKILEVLEKKELSFDNLHLVASSKSAGKKIIFKGKEYEISNLEL